MLSVHVPVGFDERGPLHCFLKARELGEVNKVVAYVPSPQQEKGKVALQNFKYIVENMVRGVEVTKVEVKPDKLQLNVLKVSRGLMEDAKRAEVVLCLSCGMRILVITLILAALTLNLELHEKVWLYFEIEGDPTTSMLFKLSEVSSFIAHLYGKNELQRAILQTLSQGSFRLQDVHKILLEEGLNYSKTWVREVLKDLVKEGLVVEERGYYKLKLGARQRGRGGRERGTS